MGRVAAHRVAEDDVRAPAEAFPHGVGVQVHEGRPVAGDGVPVQDAGVRELEDVPIAAEGLGERRVPGPAEGGGEAGEAHEGGTAGALGQVERRERVAGAVGAVEGGDGERGGHQQVHRRDDLARRAHPPVEGGEGLGRPFRSVRGGPGGGCPIGQGAAQLLVQMARQCFGAGPVEDDGGGQRQAGERAEAIAQQHPGQGVEAQLGEGPAGGHRGRVRMAEHRGDLRADQLEQGGRPVGRGQRREPLPPGPGRVVGGMAPIRRRGRPGRGQQAAQGRRDRVPGGGGRPGPVQQQRGEHRFVAAQRGVEHGQSLLGGDRAQHAGPGPGGGVGARRHPVPVPGTPREGERGQTEGGAVVREGVQEGVGGGVVGLAGIAEQPGRRGEQHEARERQVPRQLVQVPGRVRLRPQHRCRPLGRQRLQHTVVHDSGGVHDGGQARPVLLDDRGQLSTVGGVARDHVHAGAGPLQRGPQPPGALGSRTTTADEHEMPDPVPGDQVPGQQPAEGPGAAGEQDGAAGREVAPGGGEAIGLGQSGDAQSPFGEGELRLARGEGGGQQAQRLGPPVRVDEREPAGVLRLRGTRQAPHPGGGQVGCAGAGAARHHDQTRSGPGQMLPQDGQGPCGQGVGVRDRIGGCAGGRRGGQGDDDRPGGGPCSDE